MAEYSTPVYPHGTGHPAITDQITDQNTPYCDELSHAVSNDIRMLAVTQRLEQASNLLPGAPLMIRLKQSIDRSPTDNILISSFALVLGWREC